MGSPVVKGKIFDNCLIQAPDGVNLSRCGKRKAHWYLDRGLAEIVADDPLTIRLRFEPSGRRGLEDPLLLEGKPNICVVCGTPYDLTRHHIIPYCFIKHMQLECKADIIRDIFPLCEPCHNEYEKHSAELRKEIAEEVGIDFSGLPPEKARDYRSATGAASALLNYSEQIPEDKKDFLLAQIKRFLGKATICEHDLHHLTKLKIEDVPGYVNFSKLIAENVTDYNTFAIKWREHFIRTMKPKHMPDAWKVDRKIDLNQVWVPDRMIRDHARKSL